MTHGSIADDINPQPPSSEPPPPMRHTHHSGEDMALTLHVNISLPAGSLAPPSTAAEPPRTAAPGTGLGALPAPILLQIAVHLPVRDALSLQYTSRRINDALSQASPASLVRRQSTYELALALARAQRGAAANAAEVVAALRENAKEVEYLLQLFREREARRAAAMTPAEVERARAAVYRLLLFSMLAVPEDLDEARHFPLEELGAMVHLAAWFQHSFGAWPCRAAGAGVDARRESESETALRPAVAAFLRCLHGHALALVDVHGRVPPRRRQWLRARCTQAFKVGLRKAAAAGARDWFQPAWLWVWSRTELFEEDERDPAPTMQELETRFLKMEDWEGDAVLRMMLEVRDEMKATGELSNDEYGAEYSGDGDSGDEESGGKGNAIVKDNHLAEKQEGVEGESMDDEDADGIAKRFEKGIRRSGCQDAEGPGCTRSDMQV